jgi:hypothetical protein
LARVVATQAGIVLGLVMALIVLLVLHDRRAHSAAPRPTPSNRAAIEEAELHLFRYIDG